VPCYPGIRTNPALGGETIKDMQATTGCKINVSQASGADIEREIGLVGSRQAIEDAKRAIDEKVNQVVSSLVCPVYKQSLMSYRRRRMAVAVVAAEIRGITTVTTATHTSSNRVTVSLPASPAHHNKPRKEMLQPLTRMPFMVATTTISPCGIPHSSNRDSNPAKHSHHPVLRHDVYTFE
jgi:hypothetical protein